MTQVALPVADISNVDWTNHAGVSTGLWSAIADASDTTYMKADGGFGTGAAYVAELSNPRDPGTGTGHVLRVRASASAGGSGAATLSVALLQGATVIKAATNVGVLAAGVFADYAVALSVAEADAITDYTDLRLQLTETSLLGVSANPVVSRAVLDVPDATSVVGLL